MKRVLILTASFGDGHDAAARNLSVNAALVQAPGDLYCVTGEATATVLRARGVPGENIRALGFPVSPLFCATPPTAPAEPGEDGPYRILYLVNAGKKKLGKALHKLRERPEVRLTIAVGRNAHLKAKLLKKLKRYGERVRVLGWANQMRS